MSPSLLVLLGCVVVALAVAYTRGADVPLRGIAASGRMLGSVWPELVLGFVLAGLLDVLIPQDILLRWLGAGDARSIAIGAVAGLALPGGPYVLFPIAARLADQGASPGALIALISAKTLVSPIRAITYEAPLLGWQFTLSRLLPSLIVPWLLGVLGQRIFALFSATK